MTPPHILARRIQRVVLASLLDRQGFRQVWDDTDNDIRLEIRGTLYDLIHDELKKGAKP